LKIPIYAVCKEVAYDNVLILLNKLPSDWCLTPSEPSDFALKSSPVDYAKPKFG